MHDPLNPTAQELHTWLYGNDETLLDEEWEFIISDDTNLWETMFTAACDPACPRRFVALQCLYIASYENGRPANSDRQTLLPFIERAKESGDFFVRNWGKRTQDLFAGNYQGSHKSAFDEWCHGRFIDRDRSA